MKPKLADLVSQLIDLCNSTPEEAPLNEDVAKFWRDLYNETARSLQGQHAAMSKEIAGLRVTNEGLRGVLDRKRQEAEDLERRLREAAQDAQSAVGTAKNGYASDKLDPTNPPNRPFRATAINRGEGTTEAWSDQEMDTLAQALKEPGEPLLVEVELVQKWANEVDEDEAKVHILNRLLDYLTGSEHPPIPTYAITDKDTAEPAF